MIYLKCIVICLLIIMSFQLNSCLKEDERRKPMRFGKREKTSVWSNDLDKNNYDKKLFDGNRIKYCQNMKSLFFKICLFDYRNSLY